MLGCHIGGHNQGLGLDFKMKSLGINTCQIMLTQLKPYPATIYKDLAHKAKVSSKIKNYKVYIHMNYTTLIKGEFVTKRDVASIYWHLVFCEAVGMKGLVIHMGPHTEEIEDEAVKRFVEIIVDLKKKLEEYGKDQGKELQFTVPLMLENTKGSKSSEHVSVNRLGEIAKKVNRLLNLEDSWIKICFDSAHAFADGIDGENQIEIMQKLFNKRVLGLIHLNNPDPKVSLGSKLDRHDSPFTDSSNLTLDWAKSVIKRFPLLDHILERTSEEVIQEDLKNLQYSCS